MIEIVLYPPFANKKGIGDLEIPHFNNMTLKDVLSAVIRKNPGIKKYITHEDPERDILFLVDGHKTSITATLKDNSKVTLLSLSSGG